MKRETVPSVMQKGKRTGYVCVGLPWEVLAQHYLGAAAPPLESFHDPCPPKMLRSVVTGECEPFKAAGPLKYPKPKAPKALPGVRLSKKDKEDKAALKDAAKEFNIPGMDDLIGLDQLLS
jgi:hypothetical protein